MMKLNYILIGILITISPLFADTFGYINMESVFTSAKMVKEFQSNMKDKQEDYETFLKKQQKK